MSTKKGTPPGSARHTPHHLPWDRFSKPMLRPVIKARPSIAANNPDLDDLTFQVWKLLEDLNDPYFLFRRDGKICRVEADDTGAPVPVTVDTQRMLFMLVELFDWTETRTKKDADGNPVSYTHLLSYSFGYHAAMSAILTNCAGLMAKPLGRPGELRQPPAADR